MDVNSVSGSSVSSHTSPPSSVQAPQRRLLFRDVETRGVLDLRKVGAHRYAADTATDVLRVAYARDDQRVQIWKPNDPTPSEFIEAARDPSWLVVAHNDPFESLIEQRILGPRYGWPLIPIAQHRCTMAMALAASLPAKLSVVADALELRHRKDRAGERLMMQMAKPRRPRQGEDPAGSYWFEDDERLLRLCDYVAQDVRVCRELFHQLSPLPASERAIWRLNCVINDRGFAVDRALAKAARKIAQAASSEIDVELAELTDGAVTTIHQVPRLLQWARERGYSGHSLQKEAVERGLEHELPAPTRRALELRLGRSASGRQEDRCAARSCRRRRSGARRLQAPWCIDRPLEWRRLRAAKLEKARRRRSRRRYCCCRDRRYRTRETVARAAACRDRRLQSIDDRRGTRARVDRRGFQHD